MVWVIQRDFLLGKSAIEAVNHALAPVPNPGQDRSIDQACPHAPAAAAIPRVIPISLYLRSDDTVPTKSVGRQAAKACSVKCCGIDGTLPPL